MNDKDAFADKPGWTVITVERDSQAIATRNAGKAQAGGEDSLAFTAADFASAVAIHDCSNAITTGEDSAAITGIEGRSVSFGPDGTASTSHNGIAVSFGIDGQARTTKWGIAIAECTDGGTLCAGLGSWLVAVWFDSHLAPHVLTAPVDGTRIKPDTLYEVVAGEFVEVEQ